MAEIDYNETETVLFWTEDLLGQHGGRPDHAESMALSVAARGRMERAFRTGCHHWADAGGPRRRTRW